jgi:hypothetical protein
MNSKPQLARLVSLAALVLVFPGPASAGIDPASYQHVDVNHEYPAPSGTAGGYISCPAGTKAVASGATSSQPSELLTGLTTFDGSGVFATAWGTVGYHLQLSARCVAAAQVQDSTLARHVIRRHRPVPSPFIRTGRASCPPGTIAYGGGGFFSEPGGQPFGVGVIIASMPDANGTGWFFATAGGQLLPPEPEMWISTHCLPRAQFGQIISVTATDTVPPGNPGSAAYPILSAAARCPSGFSAYAGGASWHRKGSSTPAWVGYLTVSNMTADDKGWFARGWAFAADAQLVATVQCMTRRIDRVGPRTQEPTRR